MRHLYTLLANQDLVEIWDYIANDNQDAADSLLRKLDKACGLIAKQPHMGRLRKELGAELRSYVVAQYVVFYQVRSDDILIVRILHSARDIQSLFER